MSEKEISNSFNSVLCLIGEYESKYDNPNLEGFSGFIERRKQYLIEQYKEHLRLTVEKKPCMKDWDNPKVSNDTIP